MVQAKYKVRLERLAAEREALAATRVTFQVFTHLARDTLEQVEEGAAASMRFALRHGSEVLRQLMAEGLAFRRMHRPKSSGPMKPARPKRVPFPIDIWSAPSSCCLFVPNTCLHGLILPPLWLDPAALCL